MAIDRSTALLYTNRDNAGDGDVAAGDGGAQGGAGGRSLPASSKNEGKSCKGCLYYSSLRKSEARNPLCVGLTGSLKQVPRHAIGESEMEATKEGRGLSDFQYACIGYSVFINNKDGGIQKQENPVQLPLCVGLELLVDRRPSTTGDAHSHVHEKDRMPSTTESGRDVQPLRSDNGPRHAHDRKVHPPRQETKTADPSGRTFFEKFSRSSGIVASGVAKDLMRVGRSIKNYLKDIA